MGNNNPSEEELMAAIEIEGKKLAVLIAHSNMPQDIKESWLALIPKMTIEQIERFLAILEAKYVDEQTREADRVFKNEAEKIMAEHEAGQKETDRELLENLKNLLPEE